ncbi:MAG: sel1 repeat family protein [Alphaproteobacteria bacterium]|nr:sel1 repeat family protein [Alphaproteobacteria bacterium]
MRSYNIKMMKKKLFYLACFLFFVSGVPILADASLFGEDIQAEMNKIKEYNELQQKNRKFIKDYEQKNPETAAVKDDAYWDLAFHAKFADYGDKDSQFIIAKAYEEGAHTSINLKKALAFYKKAAENGHLEAAMKLGRVYLEEKWVQKDEEKALYYYLKAAQKEYAPAQMKVAKLYEEKQEYQTAYYYMEKALKQMFPNESDLEKKSYDLKRLGQKITEGMIIERDDSYDLSENEG